VSSRVFLKAPLSIVTCTVLYHIHDVGGGFERMYPQALTLHQYRIKRSCSTGKTPGNDKCSNSKPHHIMQVNGTSFLSVYCRCSSKSGTSRFQFK
jgi:hypothetical protein